MINIAQGEFEQLVRHYTSSIAEAKQRMIGEHCPQTHRTCMQYSLMAQVAEGCVAMHNLDLLADEDLS
jgi:hypothetical protein